MFRPLPSWGYFFPSVATPKSFPFTYQSNCHFVNWPPVVSSTNSGYCEFGAYISIKHTLAWANSTRGSDLSTSTSTCTPFLLVGSIHQQSLPPEGLPASSSQHGKTLLAQRRVRRVSTHRQAPQWDHDALSKRCQHFQRASALRCCLLLRFRQSRKVLGQHSEKSRFYSFLHKLQCK